MEAVATRSESGPTQLLPREPHSASSPIALNCICEHLCCILIYVVHLLARCVLKYQRAHKGTVLSVIMDIIKHFNPGDQNNDVCVYWICFRPPFILFTWERNKSWKLLKLFLVLVVAKWLFHQYPVMDSMESLLFEWTDGYRDVVFYYLILNQNSVFLINEIILHIH